MNINCKQPLKELNGINLRNSEGKDFTLGEALGNIIAGAEEGGKMKCFILAQKFATQDNVQVDSADLSLIKNAVKTTRVYTGSLIPGQCEMLLEEIKESSNE